MGQALDNGELELHYQPICLMAGGQPRLTGVEALLRWRSGGRLSFLCWRRVPLRYGAM